MKRNQGMASGALPTELQRFASELRACGYTAAALSQLLGIRVPDDVGPLNHAAAVERLSDDRSPAAALTRLFFLETDETARSACRRLGRDARLRLSHARLVRERRGRLRARLRIDPLGDHWILSDLRFRCQDQQALGLPRGDPVYPPSADSLLLRDNIIQHDGGMVLDLCTGSGVLALAAARSASRVVAVDVDPRAVAMARVNAALNCVGSVEVRQGDLYRPVAGQQFDTVIANPPFVPSPYRRGPAYHSGGVTGARLLRRILVGLDTALQREGRFFAVCHLALRRRESVAAVLRPWLQCFPGRALALVLETGSVIDLAAAQALFALADGLAAYASEVKRWVSFLRRHQVREIVLLLLVAELAGRRQLDVVQALQRTLPLPLSHPPRHHIEQWLADR